MSKINKRQVGFGGNYGSLYDFAKRIVVKQLPFTEGVQFTVAGANYALVPSTILAGFIALNTDTETSGGYVAIALAGAVGAGNVDAVSQDDLGNIANIVPIRNATTHDPVKAGDREVFALVQAASTVTDGDAIGGVGSENLQVSFVYIAADGTLTLTNVTETVEIAFRKAFTTENLPEYEVEASSVMPDIVAPIADSLRVAEYTVTADFLANEVIDLTDGTGATAGTSTTWGTTLNIDLGADANAFRNNNLITVYLNGVEQVKGTDIIYDTLNTAHMSLALDVGDVLVVKYYSA